MVGHNGRIGHNFYQDPLSLNQLVEGPRKEDDIRIPQSHCITMQEPPKTGGSLCLIFEALGVYFSAVTLISTARTMRRYL